MRMYDLIKKKRDGETLTNEEIDFLVDGYTNERIPDYQMSAFLMATMFNKLNKRETYELTLSMAESGEILDLSEINGLKVDKHSTGGVGDKTTLIVAPLVASCGVPVAKMSGRGLGHTGGTIDKLESIEGFETSISRKDFISNVNKYKIAIAGQTANLAPADKKLYALRDVTATVDNISLIAASIMSKKLASGADAIVLDVKTGSGAFMKNTEDSFKLAREMVDIGTSACRNTIGVITDMNQPLGNNIGNSLEVIEAIETLQGKGPKDLEEISLTLGAYMLLEVEKVNSFEEGKKILEQKIKNGEALNKLKELIKAQKGNENCIEDISILPVSKNVYDIKLHKEGYVNKIETEQIGIAAMKLGAGRETKESKIDHSVGIKIVKKIGDKINENDTIARLYYTNESNIEEISKLIIDSYEISQDVVKPLKIIKGLVTDKEDIVY